MWRWVSTKPGMTMRSRPSMTSMLPSRGRPGPIAAMLAPSISTSARGSVPSPSSIVSTSASAISVRPMRVLSVDVVLEDADAVDGDPHAIAVLERELVGRDDAGAGEQDGARRVRELGEEGGGELREAALHLADRRRAFEDARAVTLDPDLDGGRGDVAGIAGQHDRSGQPERVVVDLGLRQVERVGALDGARRDVVGHE